MNMDSRSNYLKVYSACLNNARDLTDEAQVLKKSGGFARAYVLAFTALEEISKSQIAADCFTGLINPDKLQSSFRNHATKIKRVEWVIDSIMDYQHEHGLEYQGTRPNFETRNKALYVDIGENNSPVIPEDSITEEYVSDLINLVEVGLNEIWMQTEYWGHQIGTKGFMK